MCRNDTVYICTGMMIEDSIGTGIMIECSIYYDIHRNDDRV